MNYSHLVDDKRLDAYTHLIATIDENLPSGFEKMEQYGGISYVVPLTIYPQGYHVTANTPLPFINVIAQKRHIGLYHLGLYADEVLLQWFEQQYSERVATKLNMGKSCIRFINIKHIPYDLIGELVQKWTPTQWIEQYEKHVSGRK